MKKMKPFALLMPMLLLAWLMAGCGSNYEIIEPGPSIDPVMEGRELLAFVETEEEAVEIADLYGIQLLDYSYNVAVYHTEEDPREVIERGEKNGYPPIDLNRQISLDPPADAGN